MPFAQAWLDVDFGSAYPGLATVGYRLFKLDGSDSVARTTTGVDEVGSGGSYGVPNVTIPDDAVGIEWDTGGGSPVYAIESLEPYRMRKLLEQLLRNRLELAAGSGLNWVLYADDDVTPILSWPVRDKNDGDVAIDAGAPSKRTLRGV